MKTINSLSGGKTSSYLAVHYPADFNIFALVQIEDPNCKPKDESIVKYVSEKLGKDFIATAESDLTLYAMRDLEQLLGREIIWVGGKTFEQVNKKASVIPNQQWRFCTS
jgi:diphthamide synthase (EF-2-diphthine--ammonia ligase)